MQFPLKNLVAKVAVNVIEQTVRAYFQNNPLSSRLAKQVRATERIPKTGRNERTSRCLPSFGRRLTEPHIASTASVRNPR
jgi:hypothetical protein